MLRYSNSVFNCVSWVSAVVQVDMERLSTTVGCSSVLSVLQEELAEAANMAANTSRYSNYKYVGAVGLASIVVVIVLIRMGSVLL